MNPLSLFDQCFAEAAVLLQLATQQQVDAAVAEATRGEESLAASLVRRGVIAQTEANAIGTAVRHRLARTGGDAHPTPTIDKFQTESPSPRPTTAEAFKTRSFAPGPQLGEAARFEILRPHARGGLGQVSIARDLQIRREIALKEILPSSADDPGSRQRFLREAEITGALEHPGVVPVYSLGEYADGRPYYAMRFIRGEDLSSAIEILHQDISQRFADPLAFRQLLGRFVDVCQAVDYAHSRGIVHRDIKPENIMLGDYGETLVVDWGLARPADEEGETESTLERIRLSPRSSSSHTQAGQVVGTPAYMSPEQASGRLDLMGPAADIYSLGATLYHLVTGRAPFSAESRDVLGSVQRGSFELPRQANPSVAPQLDAICRRAMATDPKGRYASARELGLDIERYLADEKVDAYDEPAWSTLSRWGRNHRAAVLSGMAASFVAVVLLTTGVVLLGAANRRERAARQEATENYHESVKQRQRAEQNFTLAQDAVRDFFIQVSEETLLSQPGMQPLRNALLQQALLYYEQFLTQRADDPTLVSELAEAGYLAGKITQTIASPEAALPRYQESIELYQALREDLADNFGPERQADLARVLNALGGAHHKLRQLGQARAAYQQALELRQRVAESNPDDAEAGRELSNSLMNLGTIALQEGDYDAAIRQMERAQTLRQAHVVDRATPRKLRRDLAVGYFNLAAAQLASAQVLGERPDPDTLAKAEQNLVRAAEGFAELSRQTPQEIDPRQRLAIANRLLGDLAASGMRRDAAMDYYRKAREALQQLVERNPSVPEFQVDLAGLLMNIGAQQAQIGELESALEKLRQAVQLLTQLVSGDDAPPRYRRDLAAARRAEAQVLARLGQVDEARESLVASKDALQTLVREFPGDDDFAGQLRQTLDLLEELSK